MSQSGGMGSVIGIAAVAGLAWWGYNAGLFGSLFGSSPSAPAPTPGTPTNPASGAGTNPTPSTPATFICGQPGFQAALLKKLQALPNGATYGPGLPGQFTIDEYAYYGNEICTGAFDEHGLTADKLFPGRDDRGGPLNWSAMSGYMTQNGLSGPRRIASNRVARGRILRRVA